MEFVEQLFSPKVAVMLSQSGWEAIDGKYTLNKELKPTERLPIGPAPLLIGYICCVLVGAGLGLVVASNWRRRVWLVGVSAAIASAILWIQTLAGFPVSHWLEAEKAKQQANGAKNDDTYLRYTSWFYLSHAATLAAVGLIVAERRSVRQQQPMIGADAQARFDNPAPGSYNSSERLAAPHKDNSNAQDLDDYP
jgi:hypothetical protein